MSHADPDRQQHEPVTINSVLRHTPHRYPFVFLDRMEAYQPGRYIRMTKLITTDEWYFGSVPRSSRVMPTMLVVEALAQASGALAHYSGLMGHVDSPIMLFAGMDKCRFGVDARPGDRLYLDCALTRSLRNVVKVSGRATVDGRMVVELDLTAVIQTKTQLRQ